MTFPQNWQFRLKYWNFAKFSSIIKISGEKNPPDKLVHHRVDQSDNRILHRIFASHLSLNLFSLSWFSLAVTHQVSHQWYSGSWHHDESQKSESSFRTPKCSKTICIEKPSRNFRISANYFRAIFEKKIEILGTEKKWISR